MNEIEATSVLEFLHQSKDTLLGAYQHKVGQTHIYWTQGELPNSRDCQILIPIDGVKTSRTLVNLLCLNIDMPREIPLSELNSNIWIGRKIVQPQDKENFPNLKVGRKDADCFLCIWSQPPSIFPPPSLLKADDLCLGFESNMMDDDPQKSSLFPGVEQDEQFDYGNTYDDGFGKAETGTRTPSEQEFEPHSDQYLAYDEQIRRIKAISKFLAADELGSDCYVFPTSSANNVLTSSQIYIIHGVKSSYRLMRLAAKLLKEFPFLNAVGLQKLLDEQLELGWQGKYALQLVELISNERK